MKRINLNSLIAAFIIFLLTLFFYQTSNIEPVPESENILPTTLSNETIEGVLVKRITYQRNNLRYEKQQEELEKVLDIFKNNKEALEIVARSFLGGDKTTGIIFHLSPSHAKYYAAEANECKDDLRCLMVLESGMPSFRYSDLSMYLTVKNDPNLEAAIKTLDSDIVYASMGINYAMFTVNQRFFKENEKVNFTFYLNSDTKGYLSKGIRAADGWNIEIVGYNQHYRDITLHTNIPGKWDDAYPIFHGRTFY